MSQRSRTMGMVAGILSIAITGGALAADFDIRIPMRNGGAATFYVNGHVEGAGPADFMVDTGSGYLTINEKTLKALQHSERATYSRDLRGVLADGRELVVPVYVIERITIGGRCQLENVEAAVFPGTTRQILGLNALRKASPFAFSFDPPSLALSNCPLDETIAQADTALLPAR